MIRDLIHLIYPYLCINCKNIIAQNQLLCISCTYKLPLTHYEEIKNNPLEKHFLGRVDNLERAYAYLFFEKGNISQKLIYTLKYKRRKDIGYHLGILYGKKLLHFKELINHIDLIIPIPLHPKKQLYRGFNQSHIFAQGLSTSTGIPLNKKNPILRKKETSSQTNKSKIERWENTLDSFIVDP